MFWQGLCPQTCKDDTKINFHVFILLDIPKLKKVSSQGKSFYGFNRKRCCVIGTKQANVRKIPCKQLSHADWK